MEKDSKNTIRTRFAPSPTGELHIGSARAALFPYLFAKKNRGEFLVRIEDTDQKRLVKDSELRMLDLIKWLGMSWDAKPIYQSARTSLYKEYARQLVEDGKAYFCFCSEERLEELRKKQEASGVPTGYDRKCRNLNPAEVLEKIKNGEPHVIRLKVPESGKISFTDLIRGKIEFDFHNINDELLLKSDGFPTYHLAAIVDDHEQGITHIFRGEEWLSSVPKHLLLFQYFGWEPPQYAHMSVIVGKDKKKLSKREGSVSVDAFKSDGYLPEAIVNFIALLGWNPGDEREFFNLKELEREFDLAKVNKSPAMFDIEKLNHFNAHYIRKMGEKELLEKTKLFSKVDFSKYDKSFLQKETKVIKERMVLLKDFDELSHYFFSDIDVDKEMVKFGKSEWQDTEIGLEKTIESLAEMDDKKWESVDDLNHFLSEVVTVNGLKNGDVFWPVRVALSGEKFSPSPAELIWVFGKEESLKRLKNALNKIK